MKQTALTCLRPVEIIKLPNEIEHHDHDHHQLVIGLTGYSEFSIEGENSLIMPGQGCMVMASADHAFNGVGTCEILTLNIPQLTVGDHQLSVQDSPLFYANHYFKLDNQFQCLLQLLVKEIQVSPEDLLVANACKNTIMALLQRHIYRELPSSFLQRHRINMTIIDNYIMQQIASKITIAQLAGCVFLGESQFHLLFKQQVGMTPHQYILQKRLNYAKDLLKDSTLTLTSIASASGFANQSSFTHSFTKLQGLSPSKYRN